MAQKYTITHIMPPAFVTLSEQKYLMPGWIPVSNDVTAANDIAKGIRNKIMNQLKG
jgi:hypothetical protein